MPSDAAFKVMNLVHRAVIGVSRGRLGWRVGGVRALALTTTGRTSGKPRTVMLNGFDDVAGAIAVVASRGGDDRHPDWFLNLTKDPIALVSVAGGPPVRMRAQVAEEPQRTEVYERIAARQRSYAGYQRRTDRVIPIVLLQPAGPS